jgi:hypothetical protein
MTAKWECVFRVGENGNEGYAGITGNSGNTSLFGCHVNVATSP